MKELKLSECDRPIVKIIEHIQDATFFVLNSANFPKETQQKIINHFQEIAYIVNEAVTGEDPRPAKVQQ